MTSIQAILVLLSLVAAILGSVAFRAKLGYRLLAAFFFVTACGFILVPDATSRIAQTLGVGRGADLLLYLGFLCGIHLFLLLYLRSRRLERMMTEQIRSLALREARRLGG